MASIPIFRLFPPRSRYLFSSLFGLSRSTRAFLIGLLACARDRFRGCFSSVVAYRRSQSTLGYWLSVPLACLIYIFYLILSYFNVLSTEGEALEAPKQLYAV